MGVLLLLVAAAGVYLLVQQIRGLRNLSSQPDLGHMFLPPGEHTVGGPLPPPPPQGPVRYPPFPGKKPSERAPWEQ